MTFSANSIVKFLKNEHRSLSVETIYNYLKWLSEAFIIYPCRRYDLQGKSVLKTQEKYYLSDISIKYSKMGFDRKMISAMLENIVYLEMKRRGYEVYIGKNGMKEIDFVGVRRDALGRLKPARAKFGACFVDEYRKPCYNVIKVGDMMILKDKTVLFLGSSVTYGSDAGGISFADIKGEVCGINCMKEAVSGTTLADIDDSSYVSRLKTIDKNIKLDLFICQLSTNDASTSRNIELYKTEQAIRFILEYVKRTFGCPIIFYTGTYFESEAYANMIRLLYNLQKEYDFYILDLYHDEDMLAVSKKDYQRYMKDPIHPTITGYKEWWTPKFIYFCEQLPQ